MNSVTIFLLRSTFVAGLFVAWYWLALRNRRMYNYNRAFLLFTLYASIQIPLLQVKWFAIVPPKDAPSIVRNIFVQPAEITSPINSPEIEHIDPHFVDWNTIALTVFAAVSALLLTILITRIVWILRISKRSPKTLVNGITMVHTTLETAPFSFFRLLFWKDSIPMDSPVGQMILRHELTHIRQRHSVDIMICRLCTCVLWINPFYWIIQRELKMVHEFIADEAATCGDDTEALATMLLQTHYNGKFLTPEHQFFSSPIKRRITMLQTTQQTSKTMLRKLILLPLAGVAMLTFSFSTKKPTIIPAARAAKKIVLMVDPGHGGKDAGASFEALKEKDLNLRVAQRLKEMCVAYNIDVHLTRNDDNYLPLDKRAAMCDELKADDFISIHVNDGNNTQGRYLAIDDKSAAARSSSMLSGAVLSKLTALEQKKKNPRSYRVRTDLHLAVLRNRSSSMLIELGNINNKEDVARLTNPVELDELCNAILAGVVEANQM